MVAGNRDPYWNKEPEKRKEIMWRCECGHKTGITTNVYYNFGGDWSGVMICPSCGLNMRKEDKDE